jgi:hypothetical protein
LSITLTGQTFPCAVQITGGTINGVANTTAYHSVAMSAGNVNATPLTDLLIANLAGTATPSVWFANLTTAQLAAITQTKVNTALTNLQGALGSTLPTSINPITTAFTPAAGVQMDDVLSALAIALTNNGTSHANLLASAGASTGAAFTPPAGFGAAFAGGFTKTLTGGGTPAPSDVHYPGVGVPLGGSIVIVGTNLLPITQVIFTGPAIGTNSSPTVASNLRTVGIMVTQSENIISVTLPSSLVAGTYTVSAVHPGGEVTLGGTLIVLATGISTTVLSAPTNVVATANASGTEIDLTWSAVVGATGYNIYRSSSAGVATIISTKVGASYALPSVPNGATTAYFLTGLSAATKYYYVITTLNTAGESVASLEVSATTGQ